MNKFFSILLSLILLIALSVTVVAAESDAVSGYATLQKAVNDAAAGSTLVLLRDVKEDVTVSKDLTLDLNGNSILGTLTAADDSKVQIKDSKTDDYTVSDLDYGTITSTSGDVCAALGYFAIEEDGTSYHKLVLRTTGATLRADNSGMYYTCEFAGDEVIKRNISGYGVALGVNAAPSAADIAADTGFKKHAEYSADTWATGNVMDANGVLLKGILKPENGYSINKRNANTAVYGVAYLRIGDTYHLGNDANLTMKSAVEYADTKWSGLDDTQKQKLLAMHETYGV